MKDQSWFVLLMEEDENVRVMSTKQLEDLIHKLDYEDLLSIFVAQQQNAGSNWNCIVDEVAFQAVIFDEEETRESFIGNERRMHTRYEAKLKVLINYGNTYFSSYTINVSRGGLRLEGPAPTSMEDKKCTIQLAIENDEKSKPLCYVGRLKNVNGQARVMFEKEKMSGENNPSEWGSTGEAKIEAA